MANVGYATLTVSPSLRGMQSSLQNQLGGIMPGAGKRAGVQFGSGIQVGAQQGVGRLSGAMGAIGGAVSSATSRIRSSFAGAFGAASRGASDLGDQFRGMATLGASMVAGLGFVNMISDIYQVATGAQHTEAVLEGLYETAGHGADEAQKMMGLLNDRFSRSGIAMQAFQQGASDLAYLGLSAKETADILQFMEATIGATGGSAEELARVTTALASAQNAGRASAAELNMISQAGVPIYDMLADHLGITNAQIRDLTGSGELLVDDVLAAIQAQGGTWASGLIDGAERANRTWASAWDSMRNTMVNGISGQVLPLLDRVSPVVHRMAAGVGRAFDALPGALSRLKSAMDQYGITDALWTIYNAASSLARGAAPLLGTMGASMAVVFGAVVLAAEPLAELLIRLGEWMQNNTETVRTFGVVVGVLSGVLLTLKTALSIGGAVAALANPVGLVIAAIGLLVAGITYAWKNSQTFRDVVTGAWEWIKNAVSSVVDWFTGTAWPAIKDFWARITEGASGTGQMWANSWNSIREIFATVWEVISGLWDQYGEGILATIRMWVGWVQAVWSGLWTALPGVLSGAWTIISGVISGALDVIKGILDFAIGLFTGDWERMWDGWITIGEGLWTAIVSIFEGLVQAIGGILTGLWEMIRGIWETIYDWLVGNSIVPDLVEAIVSWFQSLSDWIGAILSAMWAIIRAVWTTISNGISTVVDTIVSVVSAAWEAAKAITFAVFSTVHSIITGVWNRIRSTVSNAITTVRAVISAAWTFVRNTTRAAWVAIVSAVTTRVSSLMSTVRGIPGRIYDVFSSIGSNMRTIGRNIITGIINGVTGAATRLYDSLRNLASNALDSAKSALGIASPSKVFRDEVGGEIVAGLLGGIAAGQRDVDRAMSDLVDARPVLRVPVSPEVERHATARRQQDAAADRAQVARSDRAEQLLADLLAAVRRQEGDVIVRVDSTEVARATRAGERLLARR